LGSGGTATAKETPVNELGDGVTRTISIHSYRGGTGKSNLVANLAAALARAGKRVAVFDTDIQSPGVHVLFGLAPEQIGRTLNDFLWSNCTIVEAAYDRTSVLGECTGSVHLVPSSIKAGDIARIIKQGFDVGLLNDGFEQLADALNLDFLLIDTHPGVNEETLLSIAVSDTLLLVVRPDRQDFQGTAVTIDLARQLDARDTTIILNKVPPGIDPTTLTEQAEKAFGVPVLAVLPLSEGVMTLGSKAIFGLDAPDDPYPRGVSAIAARLMRE
jgi:MinD-like ATPase involved in chromosome partitioning or flagellar assembly